MHANLKLQCDTKIVKFINMALVKLNVFFLYFTVVIATLPSFFNNPTTSICLNLIINYHSLFLNVLGMNYGSINTDAKYVFSNNLFIINEY